MIKVKLLAGEASNTVLASAFISCIDIVAAKTHLALGDPVIANQKDYTRNPNNTIYQSDGFVAGRDRKIAPAVKIKRLILLVNGAGNSLVE